MAHKGIFSDVGEELDDIDFSFDKFVTEIVDNEEKAKKKKKVVEETDVRKRLDRYTDRAGNRIRYRGK